MKTIKKINGCLLVIGLLLLFSCYSHSGFVIIENDNFKYEIAKDGKNLHFIDKASDIDYLYADTVSYCASIVQDGKEYYVTSVSLKNDLLTLEFDNTDVRVEVLVTKAKDRVTMEVVEVSGPVESLTFLNIPLNLEGMPCEPFAACVLSMNLFTRVRQLPALQTHLWASCYQHFGMKGAKINLLGVPQKEILPVIRDVMEKAEDIPLSTEGGAWAQMKKEGYGSYLMQFGKLTEETVDDWIKMCAEMGFNQIDNHGGNSRFFTFGDFKLNSEKWPDGWDSFKRINKRLHDAGISSIFHTYAFFIDKGSKYVTPVPHPDLGYSNSYTLAEPVGPNDNEIVVKESTAGISTITGFLTQNSVTIRLGDELITFSGVTNVPPYKFTGCKRGASSTKVSSHLVGEKVFHMKELFGRFVPGPETELFTEIAKNTAEVVNKSGFDGIYFDAIDGSYILDGGDNAWYYGTKFIFEVAKQLEPPVGMEMSAMEHHWWHYRTRWQAWDKPTRGYKRFVDIHAASIKSGNRPAMKGLLSLIDKYASAENGNMLLPLHFGWWQNHNWDPPQVEPSFSDDMEYLGCKMIGNNAGLSMLITDGVDEKSLDKNPRFRKLNAILRQYEALRHENYFSDSVRTLLRQPGKEFTLFREQSGKWNFKPRLYQKHKITGTDHPSVHWTVNNKFKTQPVRLRIEPLMAVKPYNSSENIVLADFSEPEEFINKGTAEGISGEIKVLTEKTVDGGNACVFSARSTGVSPRYGSWIQMEKEFDPPLNLKTTQALGVWIKGDGNGEILNFRIESPKHISFGARGDHYVKIDFTGWKYVELVEIESTEFSNYSWPDEYDTYSTFRTTVDFKSIDKIQMWYNNIPEGKEISCFVGPVKALPLVSATIENPTVTIGGEKIIFPVSMESGMYLELNSASDCKLYGPKGELIKEVAVAGKIPSLLSGDNELSFTCDGPKGVNARVQLTVISEGDSLKTE